MIILFTMMFSGRTDSYLSAGKELTYAEYHLGSGTSRSSECLQCYCSPHLFLQNTIPKELQEAAEMDGCADFSVFLLKS